MIRLQTLGSLDLRAADGTSMQPVLRQTKRLALLAYLAIEKPGQFHRRDHLLGLFWPESDLKGGRASLSQAIHFLRQYLGKDAIVNRGDEEIGLNLDVISCDAAQFQVHVGEGRFVEAMDLYTGPLLTGVFVGEAEGFEEWLEQKRDTLQRDAMKACSALADAAEGRDDHGDVAHWLRRAVAISPFDETLRRRLILALDRSGDRAAALLAYDEFEEKLKSEFESEPSAETQELMRVVRARSDAQALPMPLYNRRGATAEVGPRYDEPLKLRPRRRFAIAAVVAMLTLGGALWGAWVTSERESVKALPVNRIAVLFFDDTSPTRELTYLTDGLTATLIELLGQVRGIEVISQNGVRPFRGDTIALDSIARQLEVGTIVEGSISKSGDLLRVVVQIVNGTNGVVLQTRRFERPVGELFALLDDVSGEVDSFLRKSVGHEVQLRRYQGETDNVTAWQAVQKAQRLLADGRDRSDAGDLDGAQRIYQDAEMYLNRASQLDKNWGEPHEVASRLHVYEAWRSLMTGDVKLQDRHLQDALASADRALELNSANAAAYEARGRAQLTRWLFLPYGTPELQTLLERAERDLLQAVSLDPENARAESALSLLYESQGRFEDARQAARRALDADAYLEDADNILVRLFQASFEVGDDEDAGHWCDEVRRRMTGRWPAAHCDLLLLGWRRDADADARKALYIVETFGNAEGAALRASMRPRMLMLAAAVVGRSGDMSRAERMATEAKAAAPQDLELLLFEAAMRARVNQMEDAGRLVDEYISRNPRARARVENGRLFKPAKTKNTASH
jgi:DNA-binding SARP family transcriptional activator/TolB-like protein/tetratricopeptide (TPR) repeat protein